jgi:murein DD-endopeptidase
VQISSTFLICIRFIKDLVWPSRDRLKRLLTGAALTVVVPVQGGSQSDPAFPVDIFAGPAPAAVMVDGRPRLVYELHITSYSPIPIRLSELEVHARGSATAIGRYRGEALEEQVLPAEQLLTESQTASSRNTLIDPGKSAVIFMDLAFAPEESVPSFLEHRLCFSIVGKRATVLEKTVEGPVVTVIKEPIPVLAPPVRGTAWVAFNALSVQDHRRAFVPFDGRVRIAQRFAIDWMRLDSEGALFHDDSKKNANFFGYGAEVLAVANARVAGVKDGFPDNEGTSERVDRRITLDNIAGNYIILDLGNARYALYAHLQPGSILVRPGEQVTVGQVLGRLGNSGNSDEPHLHFQVMDGNSPLGAEGVPFEFGEFRQLGVVDSPDDLDAGHHWVPSPEQAPIIRKQEFPVNNAAVTFP